MGMIQIRTTGSFRMIDETFSAMRRGHAVALDDAIKFLENLRPEVRDQDVKLMAKGSVPIDQFEEASSRGLLLGNRVEANLRAVVEYGMKAQRCGVSLDSAMDNITLVREEPRNAKG